MNAATTAADSKRAWRIARVYFKETRTENTAEHSKRVKSVRHDSQCFASSSMQRCNVREGQTQKTGVRSRDVTGRIPRSYDCIVTRCNGATLSRCGTTITGRRRKAQVSQRKPEQKSPDASVKDAAGATQSSVLSRRHSARNSMVIRRCIDMYTPRKRHRTLCCTRPCLPSTRRMSCSRTRCPPSSTCTGDSCR